MAVLNRSQILEAQDLNTELVPVPEWGGEVFVRSLTGQERDAFERAIVEQKGKKAQVNLSNVRAKLCAYTIVDEEGNRLFSEADVESLGKKSAAALDRIFSTARRLSGLSEGDVEELEKN